MKTLLELKKQMEIDFLKTKTYEEINNMFNQLKEKLDIAESELKKLRVGDVSVRSEQLTCEHKNIKSSDGCDECIDCGARNY